MTHSGKVRAGIGGWTYEPWRGTFYPPGLPHARELEHAASRVSAIEINGTYYRLQKPESFARWAEAVPPGFFFKIKEVGRAHVRTTVTNTQPVCLLQLDK